MGLSATQDRILRTLQQAEAPLALHDIDPALGLEKPTAYRNLMALRDAGLVERTGEHKTARYAPASHVDVRWQDHVLDPAGEPDWLYHEWAAVGHVDWRFPLVSRVPDEPGRRSLNELLDHLYRTGTLVPSAPVEDLTIVVYGSCARGDAGPGSDLDVIVFLHGQIDDATLAHATDRFLDRVFDIVDPPRVISLIVEPWSSTTDPARPQVFYNIQRDGLTVFTTRVEPMLIETWRHRDAP